MDRQTDTGTTNLPVCCPCVLDWLKLTLNLHLAPLKTLFLLFHRTLHIVHSVLTSGQCFVKPLSGLNKMCKVLFGVCSRCTKPTGAKVYTPPNLDAQGLFYFD